MTDAEAADIYEAFHKDGIPERIKELDRALMPRSDPRQGPQWREAKVECRRRGGPCRICGQAIDLQLRFPHPRSWSCHHIVPIAKGGAPYHQANLAPAHLRCNQKLGTDAMPTDPTSRAW